MLLSFRGDNILLLLKMGHRLDKEGIKKGAQYAADRVNDPTIPKGVKWIWVGDYIDFIARSLFCEFITHGIQMGYG
jgi:hypothetical protein